MKFLAINPVPQVGSSSELPTDYPPDLTPEQIEESSRLMQRWNDEPPPDIPEEVLAGLFPADGIEENLNIAMGDHPSHFGMADWKSLRVWFRIPLTHRAYLMEFRVRPDQDDLEE